MGPSRAPAPMVAKWPSSSTWCMGSTTISRPVVDDRPAKQCPPLRTAISRPRSRASAIASATSSALAQRRVTAGVMCANRGSASIVYTVTAALRGARFDRWRLYHRMGGKSAKDLEIAALAGRQFGVASRAQLLAAGLSAREIERRMQAGRLQALHRGVYAVGHRVLRVEGHWMAAVLACGEDAALSHQTAPAVWELRRVGSGVIHVTVPGDSGRKRRPGIKVHRSVTLSARDVTRVRGLPVTTVARTIIDLSSTLNPDDLEELVHRADERGLVDFRDLRAARSASLQAVLRAFDPAPTRSALERRFLKLCREHQITRPAVNQFIEGYLVDFLWRDRRLIVEVDGYEHHGTRKRFESDRERDVVLGARGWAVRRFTWRQLEERPSWVAAMTKRA